MVHMEISRPVRPGKLCESSLLNQQCIKEKLSSCSVIIEYLEQSITCGQWRVIVTPRPGRSVWGLHLRCWTEGWSWPGSGLERPLRPVRSARPDGSLQSVYLHLLHTGLLQSRPPGQAINRALTF